MEPQLFLDALERHAIGGAIDMVGYEKEAEAARARLVIGAGEQAMADAGCHVVRAEGNPDLLARHQPLAVAPFGPGTDAADIGAGFGLGNADGGGPGAGDEVVTPFCGSGVVRTGREQVDGAARGASGHHQRHAAAIKKRAAGGLKGKRDIEATERCWSVDAEPAGFGILPETIDKAGGQFHLAIHDLRADAVAHRIERSQHGFGKAGGGIEHGGDGGVVAIGP